VTVQAPGRGAQPGQIATGTINGQRWWIAAALPGTGGAGPGHQDIIVAGPAVEPIERFPAMPVLSTAGSPGPVSFAVTISGGVQVRVGAVRADVSYLTVKLDDGSVLTLHPVKVYGTRAVAFAIPSGAQIAEVTAYSRQGEIGFAVPFNQPRGLAWFAAWLRPGQHQAARASGRVASGTVGGHAWAATAYLGPWGICIPVADPQPFVTQPDGSTAQARLVTIGGGKFFAFAVRPGAGRLHWAAYDRAGQMVASSGSSSI
jgi:hypothetical protein